jgi:hypothetical protein
MTNFTLCILKQEWVFAQISGGHYKKGPESSEANRQARSLHIIPKWEDANMIVIFSVITKIQSQNFSFMLFQIFTDPRKLRATFTGQVPNYWKRSMQYYSFELSLNNCHFGKRCFNYRQYVKTTGLRIKIIIWHCTPAHYDCVTPFNPRVIFATNLYFKKEAEMKPVQITTTRRRKTKVTALQ